MSPVRVKTSSDLIMLLSTIGMGDFLEVSASVGNGCDGVVRLESSGVERLSFDSPVPFIGVRGLRADFALAMPFDMGGVGAFDTLGPEGGSLKIFSPIPIQPNT